MSVSTMKIRKKVSSRTETSLEYTYRPRRHVALITPDLASGRTYNRREYIKVTIIIIECIYGTSV